MLYEKFKDLYAEHITSAFIVGPEGLPLEDFFSIDLKTLFRKSQDRRHGRDEKSPR